MAHFAEIQNDIVTNVIVIDNKHEDYFQDFIKNTLQLDGEWVQTSYNGNMRSKFAGIGDFYNRDKDRFEPSQPDPTWVWDESTYSWTPGIAEK